MVINIQVSTCSQAPPTPRLVIGATGFIGMHTCPRLVARGDKDIGLDNLIDCDDVPCKQALLAQLQHDPASKPLNLTTMKCLLWVMSSRYDLLDHYIYCPRNSAELTFVRA